jgi:hypothetical protein
MVEKMIKLLEYVAKELSEAELNFLLALLNNNLEEAGERIQTVYYESTEIPAWVEAYGKSNDLEFGRDVAVEMLVADFLESLPIRINIS